MRLLAHPLLAAIAFLAAAGVLRPQVPAPDGWPGGPKLAHFRAHAAEYDAVFLGSSRVYRHVVPRVLSERLAELGHPLRAFNLGTPGAGGFENEDVLRRVLAADGVRLRYVFVEPAEFGPQVPEENRRSQRFVRWHRPSLTRLALASAWERGGSLRARWTLAAPHLEAFALWLANAGHGGRLARDLLRGAPPAETTLDEVAAEDGYQPLDREVGGARRGRVNPTTDPQEFARRVQRLIAASGRGIRPSDASARATRAQVARIRAAGAEPVHLIPPGTVPTLAAHALGRLGIAPTLFAFNDPTAFPRLYRPERYFDMNHLDREGAEAFSRLLAESLAAWLDEREEVPGLVRPR